MAEIKIDNNGDKPFLTACGRDQFPTGAPNLRYEDHLFPFCSPLLDLKPLAFFLLPAPGRRVVHSLILRPVWRFTFPELCAAERCCPSSLAPSRWSGGLHTLSLPPPTPTPWRPGKRDHQRRGRRGSLFAPRAYTHTEARLMGIPGIPGPGSHAVVDVQRIRHRQRLRCVRSPRWGPMRTTSLVPPCWLPCCTDVSGAVVGLPRAVKR